MNKLTYIVLYAIATLFLNINISFAQQYTVNGKVVNQNREPIEFVNANLLNNDQELVEQIITDNLGSFSFIVEKGNYRLSLEYFGSEYPNQNLEVNQNLDLGELIIEESVVLEGITISARKKLIEKKIDRLVFNVENSTSATGGDALDILKITPRIKVDNDQISMIGKSAMSVMIDDKMTYLSGSDLANYLRTLKSDEIKSIEVITNPPAKYSAEGNSGIINIVTKKQRQDEWNATLRSTYQQATYASGFVGAGFNFKKNKLTVTSNLNYSDGSNAPVENYEIDYTNFHWKEQNKRRDFSKSTSAKLGLDYQISDKISTGFIYNYVSNTPETRDNIKSTLSNYETKNIDSLIVIKGSSLIKRTSNRLNYHFIYDIDKLNRKLSFDFDYFNYNSNTNHIFQTKTYHSNFSEVANSYSSANNNGLQDITNYSFNLDMEHPLSWVHLNYGSRLSYIKTDNNFEYYDLTNGTPVFDTSQSNQFKYKENTQAIYFSAQKEISEKWETKIGLRL